MRRVPARGHYDRAAIDAVLDAGFVCHLGFAVDAQPFVVPTIYGRDGDRLYVHGSAAARSLRHVGAGAPACVTVTHVDGLVLARSAFHHSVNYRSVMVLGSATPVSDPDEQRHALRVITEHAVPGRWPHVRQPSARELRATAVLALPIDESSAKIRDGGVNDDAADLDLPVWAGVLPLALVPGRPVPDDNLPAGTAVPHHVAAWGGGGQPVAAWGS